MSIPDHLLPIVRRIESLEIARAPEPWIQRTDAAVGGLTDVGFGAESDLLLAVSSQGRGVFDCLTGERIARDRNDDDSYHYCSLLRANGIGPLDGQSVSLAGLYGGGLASGIIIEISTRQGC